MRVWLVLLMAAGCVDASADPGLRALLRVEGAQFAAGAMPAPNGGPALVRFQSPHNQFALGTRDEQLSGSLEPNADAVLIGRRGDAGYWIVPAGLPRVEEPELPTFTVAVALAHATPAGPFTIEASAVDGHGRVGARSELSLRADNALAPDAPLAITLRWDTMADLDLRVIDPAGHVLDARNISAPAADGGGRLDFDSNAECVYDGRNVESAAWPATPPPGRYRGYVLTHSLCGASSAHWTLRCTTPQRELAAVSGVSTATDTRASTDDGLFAVECEVP